MKIPGIAICDVISENIVDGKTELIILDPVTGIPGTYRVNKGYGVIVGKSSYGIGHLDIFSYVESKNSLIVDNGKIELESLEVELDPNGYVLVEVPAIGYPDRAHRMVAFSYCKKDKMYMNGEAVKFDVDHLNGNKEDNRPENLEYAIPLINQYRAAANKYKGSAQRFVDELEKVFKDATPEYLDYAMNKLKEELER